MVFLLRYLTPCHQSFLTFRTLTHVRSAPRAPPKSFQRVQGGLKFNCQAKSKERKENKWGENATTAVKAKGLRCTMKVVQNSKIEAWPYAGNCWQPHPLNTASVKCYIFFCLRGHHWVSLTNKWYTDDAHRYKVLNFDCAKRHLDSFHQAPNAKHRRPEVSLT